jgi:hypothetical protein
MFLISLADNSLPWNSVREMDPYIEALHLMASGFFMANIFERNSHEMTKSLVSERKRKRVAEVQPSEGKTSKPSPNTVLEIVGEVLCLLTEKPEVQLFDISVKIFLKLFP